ncbi:ABC-type multidrug transport system permease subunit [Pedobacter cryoconitis]|uniref:ABC-type multidrug transport system permease subunit n=1 Tax=Pedobacter cryoconitis TaxID=188932 RepID=A0A7W8ZPE8_9SPHI|nr:hypothetical protein [Pedobacter cryoconitis]MBB5637758.1 ABC-type multidrug transport system permease subunit [Pedobacter cryoconitis]
MYLNTEPPYFKKPINDSALIFALSIMSLFGYFFYLLPGFVLGIIAVVLNNKSNAIYKANPNLYTSSSISILRASKVIAIIGLVLMGLVALFFILYIGLYSISDLKD